MPKVQDTKKIDDYTFYVRQAGKYLFANIVGIQIILILAFFISSFLLGFLENSFNLGLPTVRLGFIIFLVLIIADIFFVGTLYLNWKYTYYIIKPNEITLRTGIFQVKEKKYELNQLVTVSVLQGMVGRRFNYGTLRIYSPLMEDKITVFQIPDPHRYRDMIVKFAQAQQVGQVQLIPSQDNTFAEVPNT